MNINFNNKGFTLIELMLVIAVAGILALVTVPKYQAVTDHYHLESSAQHIVNRFNFAKQMAMDERKKVAVGVTNKAVQVYQVDLTKPDPLSPIDQAQFFDSGISLDIVSTTGTWQSSGNVYYVYYDWKGFLQTPTPGTNPVFTLIDSRNKKINVNIDIGIGRAALNWP
jgi:prepilin-type N-terminal cleavage/methylation domain-containing protein